MVETIILIVILILAALALIVVEICTPTFGLLSVVAVGLVAWAVYLCYGLNRVAGIATTVAVVLLLPVFIVLAVKILPKTPLGGKLALRREPVAPGEATPDADQLKSLVGRETTAETPLRPSGMIRIEGRRIAAHAESGLIPKGTPVKVIGAAGNHVIVRKAEDS